MNVPLMNTGIVRRIVLCICFLVAGYSVLFAENARDVNSFIAEAVQNNPELKAAQKRFEAADARITQSASLNDPMLEFEYDRIGVDKEMSGEPMKSVTVSQEIPFPSKVYLRARMASKLAKMEYQNYKAKERDIVSQIKAVYAQLSLLARSIDMYNENKRVLAQLSASAAARYSAGKGTQADALKSQSELSRLDLELILLKQQQQVMGAKLNVLLNRDPLTPVENLEPERTIGTISALSPLVSKAKENNPELQAYRIALAKGRTAYQLSFHEYLPDFKVSFKQSLSKGKRVEDSWAGMLGVTIPLWFAQKQVFGTKEMRAELSVIEAELSMKENTVVFDVQDAYSRYDANKRLVELYETSFIPQAEQTMNAASKGYESGQADFLMLLDSQRMLTEFKIQYYKAILELRIAVADLERIVGTAITE